MADTEDQTEHQVAIITGASSGIGRATALEFAKNGYDVVLAARRQSELRAVAEDAEQYEIRPIIVTADTSDEAAVRKIAEAALLAFNHFDVWVNNAGISLFAKFEDAPAEDFRRVIETNLFGYVNGSRAALKQFKEQGYGTLVNVSSVTAAAPQPYTSAYVASNYAIRGLSESLRMELELDGRAKSIHVCTVMPNSVDTNLFQNAANYTNREVVAMGPVHDPLYVAKHIVNLAKHPRRETIIGQVGKMMIAEHAIAPSLYDKFASKQYEKNHLGTHLAEDTAGNLYEPIQEHTGIHGGWKTNYTQSNRKISVLGLTAAALVAIASTVYVVSKKKVRA